MFSGLVVWSDYGQPWTALDKQTIKKYNEEDAIYPCVQKGGALARSFTFL